MLPAVRSLRLGLLVLVMACGGAPEPGVYPDAESVRPLAAGARVPDALVRSVGGETVSLRSLVRDRGALLVFYRGGW